MRDFRFEYLDYYIPDTEIKIIDFLSQIENDDIPEGIEEKDEYSQFIESYLKLRSIRVEEKFEEKMMIYKIISKMFESGIISPEKIDLVITTQDTLKPDITHYIQKTFGLINSYFFNISGNQCGNIDIALNIASSIMQKLENILIIDVVKISSLKNRIFGTYGILCDGAGIILLNKKGKLLNIIDTSIINSVSEKCGNFTINNMMNHFKYSRQCIKNLLDRNNLRKENIDKIIVQNANSLLIENILGSLDLDINNVYFDNIGKYGHSSLDLIINLKDYISAYPSKDKNIISFTMGSNGSYICTYFKT